VLALAGGGVAAGPPPEPRVQLAAEVSERLAYRVADDERLAQAKTQVKAKAQWDHSPRTRFTGIVRGFYDYVYDRYEQFSDDAVRTHRDEVEMRELYWDGLDESWALQLGKQQVTWGEADFFRVVDVVNPLDLRDGLLTYFDDYQEGRQPLWMANITHQGGSLETQALYIPDFEPTRLAEPGTDFAPRALEELYASAARVDHAEPADSLRRASFGVRVRGSGEQLDGALYAYYGWNPDPLAVLSGTSARLEHVRRRMAGVSLSRAVDEVTVRGDLAYYRAEPHALRAPVDGRTFALADTVSALVGVDYFGRDWTLAAQANRVANREPVAGDTPDVPRVDVSLSGSRRLLGERLTLSGLLIRRFAEAADGMFELKGDYRLTENLLVTAGAAWFFGDDRGLYGQFEGQDRVFVVFKYSVAGAGGAARAERTDVKTGG
jgi:hypothetical protein